MESALNTTLNEIGNSLSAVVPEIILAIGILVLTALALVRKNLVLTSVVSLVIFSLSFAWRAFDDTHTDGLYIFQRMLRLDGFSSYFSLLVDVGAVLTVILSWRYFKQRKQEETMRQFTAEYYALIAAVVFGAHLLVASANLVMIFLALEIVSISSYVLTGFLFDKKSTEGSLKYFLFGATASAIMLYGFSIYYGFTGTADLTIEGFWKGELGNDAPLVFIAGTLTFVGFFFKIAAVPMHSWAPDVYESAPMPVVAFLSVVPKLAGVGILMRFYVAMQAFNANPSLDWQALLAFVSTVTLIVGNFSALVQKNAKRMMAYSSIAQSGFLLVGIAASSVMGFHFMLFYATIYLITNFLVFMYLQYFEEIGMTTIASYQKTGMRFLLPNVLLLIGFISLTGLPPTAGFTAKFFIFSSLWDTYRITDKSILLWLLIIGLLNTVVSLFYYLRIPYYAFIKSGDSTEKANNLAESSPSSFSYSNVFSVGNLLGLILVIALLLFFFIPGLLMGWINKINFVL